VRQRTNYDNVLIPDYLKETLKNHSVDNAYMLFHRFLNGKEKNEKGKKNELYLKNFDFTNEISNAMKASNKKYINTNEIDDLLRKLPGTEHTSFDLAVDCSIILGLGQQSVSETSMLIHPIYGVPFIPGQAFKGVVRSYCIIEFYDRDERKAMMDDQFKTVFGREKVDQTNTEYRGAVIFHDAFIVSDKFELCQDITNCHYPGYYQSGKKLTDSENPIPIRFNVIKNAVFHFGYSIRKKDSSYVKSFGEKHQQTFEDIIKNALIYYGVGAKTAVGYGKFS